MQESSGKLHHNNGNSAKGKAESVIIRWKGERCSMAVVTSERKPAKLPHRALFGGRAVSVSRPPLCLSSALRGELH